MPKVCPVCGTTYSDSNAFCPADGTTLRSADVDGDLIGTVVADRYLVTDLLGEGGMGRVYLARHVRLPQQAAIKVLRPALLRDPASVARFNREASNASRIEHERVARVFDYGETGDGIVYLAMEYVQGRTLKKLLADEAPLAPLRAAALVKQVADGLDAAHRMGIVHRDLKPDNILVITDETGDRSKVVDFGIAKAIGGDTNEAGLTQTGFVVGTPEFMAPEQMLGGLIDARTDMYALALVAFQCLTNALPFDTTTPDRGLTARMTEAPRRLDFVASNVAWPAQLQAVFDKALVRDLDQRYATAGAFADALTAALHAWVGVAPPLTSQQASQQAFASATAPMVVSPSASATPAHRDNAGGNNTPSAPARSRTPLFAGLGVVALAAIVGVYMMTRPGSTGASQVALGDTSSSGAPNGNTATPAASGDTNAKTADATRHNDAAANGGNSLPSGSQALPNAATPNPPVPTANPGRSTTSPTTPPSSSVDNTPASRVENPPATSNANSATAIAAKHTLDSLRAALGDTLMTESQASAAAGVLQRTLPRLATLSDSVWAYISLFEANMLAGQQASACTPLRSAKRLAVTPQQIKVVQDYYKTASCGP